LVSVTKHILALSWNSPPNSVQATHDADYEGLLQNMATKVGADGKIEDEDGNGESKDGRLGSGDPGPELEAEGLITHESEDKLKAVAKVVAECKTGKGLTLLRDDKEQYYLLAKGEDMKVPSNTTLGSIGGGHFIPHDGTKRCVLWKLPHGDKTLVQVHQSSGEDDAKDSKAPKITTGTLYAIARDIEQRSTPPIKLTSYGNLIPAGTAGRQQYLFEYPEGHEKHKAMMFQPSQGALAAA
jgi:hypothetical protein